MSLRLVRLEVISRLRAIGWVPWLLLVAWLVVSRAQEPIMLRSFGIQLLDQSAKAASVIVLMLCWAAPLITLHRNEVRGNLPTAHLAAYALTNLFLLILIAVAQSLLTTSLELLMGGRWTGFTDPLATASFVLVWSPVAVVSSRWSRGMSKLAVAVDAVCILLSGAVAVAAGAQRVVLPHLAASILLLGAICVLAASPTHPSIRAVHANRHPRRHPRER